MPKFIMRLHSVGNPDYSQYAPISDPEVVTGDTLQDMVKAHKAYLDKWEMGGGNHPNITIKDTATGKIVAWVTYGGRLMDRSMHGKDWQKAKEIVL